MRENSYCKNPLWGIDLDLLIHVQLINNLNNSNVTNPRIWLFIHTEPMNNYCPNWLEFELLVKY